MSQYFSECPEKPILIISVYYFLKPKNMERIFKTLGSHNQIDLINYIKQYNSKHNNVEILVGCDSQNRKRETIYAIVIGLYIPGKGAHVLYSRFNTVREKENINRLLNEVWFSVEVAESIKNQLGIIVKWIDIDINNDKKYKSNMALTSAVGIVTGMGYNVRHKGNSPVMTYAADSLVK
jgi:predicted RNase H-related nuclease YkuK (DUF458 family)